VSYGSENPAEYPVDQQTSSYSRKLGTGSFDITDAVNLVGKRKRHRRTAHEIDRLHVCSVCGRSYGSEGSLSQHIKLKHSQQSNALLAALKLKNQQGGSRLTESEAALR
jgi:hypothetical protein